MKGIGLVLIFVSSLLFCQDPDFTDPYHGSEIGLNHKQIQESIELFYTSEDFECIDLDFTGGIADSANIKFEDFLKNFKAISLPYKFTNIEQFEGDLLKKMKKATRAQIIKFLDIPKYISRTGNYIPQLPGEYFCGYSYEKDKCYVLILFRFGNNNGGYILKTEMATFTKKGILIDHKVIADTGGGSPLGYDVKKDLNIDAAIDKWTFFYKVTVSAIKDFFPKEFKVDSDRQTVQNYNVLVDDFGYISIVKMTK